MQIAFYLSGLIAILATLRTITHTNPIHALLYFVVSLLSVACMFFTLGAYFAGALEVIVYAGAIMVLFVFVMMMLNLGHTVEAQEKAWLKPSVWIGPALLSFLLLLTLVYGISHLQGIPSLYEVKPIGAKEIGISLFSTYVLGVELASMMLLAGLVVAFHVGRDKTPQELTLHGEVLKDEITRRNQQEHN
ncbi:NADH-quinone oxidoreductase subunit J [Thorsellia kenyensis]|uniref:NADH-quinone oxidoreductase subunit J n=1 Tax=Thorsellia kenyensis TaxID=1549888 RepID=A0ABV6C6X0_9GAMM